MRTESAELAQRFEQTAAAAEAEIAAISDAAWAARCAAEGWPVGVAACHIAEGNRFIAGAIQRTAGISQIDPLGGEDIHTINARHAGEHAAVSKTDVLATFRENVAYLAGIIRVLTPEQLERSRELAPGRPPMTVRQLIEHAANGHITNHLESIRAAASVQSSVA
ncbi:MAG TPA: DinB family protein [Dehalococcoidia bacterium]|nr:DinB family protein [Dehalococcoidia bacterium]